MKEKEWKIREQEWEYQKVQMSRNIQELKEEKQRLQEKLDRRPILFEDYCVICERNTTHKSLLTPREERLEMTTDALHIWAVPVKVCLSCGTVSNKK